MFFHPKNAIAICVAAACLFGSVAVNAQSQSNNSEFTRRMAALQQARQRTETVVAPPAHRVAAQTAPRISRASEPVRVSQIPSAGSGTRVAPSVGGFVPGHLQGSPFVDGTIIDGGSPIVQGTIIDGGYSNGQIISHSPIPSGQIINGPIGSSIVSDGGVMGHSYGGEIVSESYGGSGGGCGCGGGGCDSGSCGGGGCSDGGCGGVGENFFADGCCGRGGCPDGPCYLSQFGKIFRNAEYFGGFSAFRSNLFTAPDGSGDLADDSSHGLHAGFNLGVPLCRLSCGFLSGQFGVRTVNTNFGGAQFTDDDRNQLFITTGIFRRVDYGLQFGVVADILRDEWFANSDLVQVRSEIGYVWQSGTSFGFRFAQNVQDDETDGDFNNVLFTNNLVTTNDWYRFFLRHEIARGGYGEVYGGWTDNDQGIAGLDFDFPLTNRLAFQSNFVYYISDGDVPANQGFLGGTPNDSFNVSVGFSLRPSGRKYYRNYDRPLQDVADNGTMMTLRQ